MILPINSSFLNLLKLRYGGAIIMVLSSWKIWTFSGKLKTIVKKAKKLFKKNKIHKQLKISYSL